ncbi:guanine nucleotide-binding protein g(o) subunit alpha [Anaeramoeba flamelloides]|uniref:Guanine nucleotide-binding protein g(O) subunit alpha n=1 Tax=Anaeramoeba flamelloides TaxID=1746091 RepID=A0ABQ8XQI2_9EUKA|nr:guanine nucleotide-binding protein g(o) subunit alpha [Anaeramoeba flamelloides]
MIFEDLVNKSIDHDFDSLKTRLENQVKLLLLGPGESGKSTIVKQIKRIFLGGFTKREISDFRFNIHSNIVEAIKVLSRGVRKFGYEWVTKTNHQIAKEILQLRFHGLIKEELADKIKSLWGDPILVKVLKRKNELQFFESSEQITDVGGQRNERKKWIHCFENVTSVIFVVAINEYNQTLFEETNTNRMRESLLLFDEIVNSKWLKSSSMILFLNKFDLFKKKIQESNLKKYFKDYKGKNLESAQKFICDKFLKLNKNKKKIIYPFFTTATDSDNMKYVFAAIKDTLLQNNISNIGFL